MRSLRTIAAASCALALAMPAVTSAHAATRGCPQIRDARGDMTSYVDHFMLGWDPRSLDVLSASLGSDGRDLVATVRVDRLMRLDPHSYLWTVYFKTVTQVREEWVYLR